MDTGTFRDGLQALLDGDLEAEDVFPGARTGTFTDMGLLTSNDGLVVTLADGTEFQVTVVRSR